MRKASGLLTNHFTNWLSFSLTLHERPSQYLRPMIYESFYHTRKLLITKKALYTIVINQRNTIIFLWRCNLFLRWEMQTDYARLFCYQQNISMQC